MSGILIREAKRSDKNGLIGVYCSDGFFDYAPSQPGPEIIAATVEAYLDEFVSDPASIIFFVAYVSAELAGFSIARKTARASWEVQAGVHFDHRMRGIGSALLMKLFAEMHRRGPAKCAATIHADNFGSIKMVRPFLQEHGEFDGLPGFLQFRSSW